MKQLADKQVLLPQDSVRGAIQHWIHQHRDKLGDSVLEVGSKIYGNAPWMNNRTFGSGEWLGIDMLKGEGVDELQNIHALPESWAHRFSSVLCSEVLEHVQRPWIALPELFRVTRPGGYVIITTLTSFPIHGYPDDYYRYTPSGLRLLMEDAGYIDVHTENMNFTHVNLNDHGEGSARRVIPMQVFGVGKVPC